VISSTFWGHGPNLKPLTRVDCILSCVDLTCANKKPTLERKYAYDATVYSFADYESAALRRYLINVGLYYVIISRVAVYKEA